MSAQDGSSAAKPITFLMGVPTIGHAFPQPGKSRAMGFAALNPSYMLYHR
jgi:hypothetical protein